MHFWTCVRLLLQLPYFSRMYVLPRSNIGLWQRRLWIDITFSSFFCSISTPEFDIDFFIDFGSLWHRFWLRFSFIFRESVHFWVCYFSIDFWNGFWRGLFWIDFVSHLGPARRLRGGPANWPSGVLGALARLGATCWSSWGRSWAVLVILGTLWDDFNGFSTNFGMIFTPHLHDFTAIQDIINSPQ